MYSDQQAKNGFKTFVVTLSVSLLLFGALYYLVTDFSTEVDIENSSAKKTDTIAYKPQAEKPQEVNVKGATSQGSVFGELSDSSVDTNPAVVLAGADVVEESTETPVPDTGVEQTFGITMAMVFFSVAAYFLLIGPRKLALAGFEKDMVERPEPDTK